MLVKALREEILPPRAVTVPDRARGREVKIRDYAHIPEPGPNAPKLIRLIRNPVSQELARPVRNTDIPRRTATEWVKPESARMVREALAQRGRPSWPKATRTVIAAPQRTRLSADAWLSEAEEQS